MVTPYLLALTFKISISSSDKETETDVFSSDKPII